MRSSLRRLAIASISLFLLAACGGGGGGGNNGVQAPASCSLDDQKSWLKSYMDDRYFWYSLIPAADPAAYTTIGDYFLALRSPGNATFPADRWSYSQSTADFNQFFGDGQTLGYGLFVAGLEVTGHPELPLRVRYVEPASPAAAAGALRGDTVVSVNGRLASDMIAANDFAVLTPAKAGDAISVVLRNAGGDRTVNIVASVYALQPVSTTSIVTTPGGRKMGYLVLKDFINQAVPSFDSAFTQFKAANVDDLVIDLRYNGGGLISVATALSSYAVGAQDGGKTFVALRFNDKHQGSNSTSVLSTYGASLAAAHVYVLAGQRTCSASELVVNGLRPYANVVLIGDTTCGKPVGFVPQDNACGTTFSAVNFDSVNAQGQGGYYAGIAPTCAVADDLDHPLGTSAEALLSAAQTYADSGACPAASHAQALSVRASRQRGVTTEPGEHPGMFAR